jgi:iron complex transport system substrate-binding protein
MLRRISTTMILVLLIGVLAACGGQAASDGNKNESAAATNSGGSNKSANESAAAADLIDPNAKIASMSIHMTNNLLALGIKPAGSAIGGGVGDFLPHVADMLEGTVKLGVVGDSDMEAVLGLKPDYIFIDDHFGGEQRAELERIAPVVSTDLDTGTWRDHLKQVAEHFGLEAKADAFIADYEAKTETVRQLIADEVGEGAKAMAIRVTAKELRVQSMARPVGPIMFQDLKLTPASGVEDISLDEPYAAISKEVLPDFDADVIFLLVNNDSDAQKSFAELEKNPLWLNLKAVKNNHVYALDGQKWLDYSSLGQSMAMDNAEELFGN